MLALNEAETPATPFLCIYKICSRFIEPTIFKSIWDQHVISQLKAHEKPTNFVEAVNAMSIEVYARPPNGDRNQ